MVVLRRVRPPRPAHRPLLRVVRPFGPGGGVVNGVAEVLCTSCGTAMAPNSRFCRYCGQTADSGASAAVASRRGAAERDPSAATRVEGLPSTSEPGVARAQHTPARQPSGGSWLDRWMILALGSLLLVLGAGAAGFAVVRLTSSSKEVDEGAAPGRETGAAEEPTDGARGPEGRAPAEPTDGDLAGEWSGSGVQRAPRGTRQSVSIGVNLGSLSGDGPAGIQTEAIEDEDGGTSRCRGRLTLERRSSSGVSRFTYTETHDPRNCIRQTHVTLGRTPNGSLAFRETYSTSLGTGTVTGNLKQAERVP